MSGLMALAKHVATPPVCPLPTNPAAARQCRPRE